MIIKTEQEIFDAVEARKFNLLSLDEIKPFCQQDGIHPTLANQYWIAETYNRLGNIKGQEIELSIYRSMAKKNYKIEWSKI